MEYISLKEAGEKWGVSARMVNVYCAGGRIPGAKKVAAAWLIPSDARKPADNRRAQRDVPAARQTAELPRSSPLPSLTGLYNSPGSGDCVTASLSDNPEAQALFAAQLAYFRGDIDAALETAKPLLSSASCLDARVGAGLLLALCAMYRGDVALWREAKRAIAQTPVGGEGERERLAFWLAAADSSILDNRGFPEGFRRGCFDFLPADSFPAARFFYAKYLYMEFVDSVKASNQGGESAAYTSLSRMLPPVCEIMISQTRADGALIAEIYLRLICAIAYHNNADDALAARHIDRALALALPDRLYGPLAEHRRPLDFLMDERLSEIDPSALRAVRALSRRLMEGWARLHNTLLDRRFSNELSARESEVARFAVYGLSNDQIARNLRLSVGTVKQALRVAMDKTGAENRFELAKYL